MHTLLLVVDAIALLAAALVLGGMVAFTGLFARLAFAHLPEDAAGKFVRDIFPAYHKYMLVLSIAGTLALAVQHLYDAGLMAFVAAAFATSNWWLMPEAQALEDARRKEMPGAAEALTSVQRRSALLALAQTLAAGAVLLRVAF